VKKDNIIDKSLWKGNIIEEEIVLELANHKLLLLRAGAFTDCTFQQGYTRIIPELSFRDAVLMDH
jgi:hypothetical protein